MKHINPKWMGREIENKCFGAGVGGHDLTEILLEDCVWISLSVYIGLIHRYMRYSIYENKNIFFL